MSVAPSSGSRSGWPPLWRSALRGAKLEVMSNGAPVTGRLLSVERMDHRAASGVVSQVDALSLVTDGGSIVTVALEPGVNVRILEADLNQEVGRYLSLQASARDQRDKAQAALGRFIEGLSRAVLS